MDDVQKAQALSAIRNLLAVAGGVVVAKGYADDATVQTVIGAAMILLPLVWGIVDKKWVEQKTQTREDRAMQAGAESVGAANPAPTQGATK